MDSLDDIWDAPVETSVPQQNIEQRAPSTLFLPGSDDEHNEPDNRPMAPSTTNPDIEALFADMDSQTLTYQPALDLEALRREADARHKAALTPHAVLPSSSPEKDVDANRSDDKGKKDAGEKKGRKKVPRLDEGRLLGPDGFPQLIRDTKNFKPKGKGHEAADLSRLLQVYQFWTHKMYPKTQFRDTVDRIEKICHSRRMHVSLSVWRDEAHGIQRAEDAEQPMGLTSDGDAPPAHSRSHSRAPSQPRQTASASPPSSGSRPPTRPPSSGSERTSPEPDEFDVDAFLQDTEARLELAPKSNSLTAKGANENGIDGDEEIWNELNGFEVPAPLSQHAPPQAAASLQQPKPTRSTGFAAALDEDEDMWDVVREMEMEITDVTKNLQQEQRTAPATNAVPAGIQDDWDDMYL